MYLYALSGPPFRLDALHAIRMGVALSVHQPIQFASSSGLKIAPTDAALKSGAEDVRKVQASANRPAAGGNPLSGLFGSEALLKMASHPKYSKLLSDPVFMNKFNMMQSNPSAMAQMFQDPEMMEVLSFIMGIDMKQGPGAGGGSEGDSEPFPPSPPPKEADRKAAPEEPVDDDLTDEEKAQKKRKSEALSVSSTEGNGDDFL